MENYMGGPFADPLMSPMEMADRRYEEKIRRMEAEKDAADKKREERLAPYKNVENHIYMHLMESGDAGAIKDLTIALAVIKRIQKEEKE